MATATGLPGAFQAGGVGSAPGPPAQSEGLPGYELEDLQKWSSLDKHLRPVSGTARLHIYDFDNTLFKSPMPNPELWHSSVIGKLQQNDFLYDGGWWHTTELLAALGNGADQEEQTAWQGYWIEKCVEEVEKSIRDCYTLTVLLTGRSRSKFASLVERMVKAKSLNFDMLVLKTDTSPEGQVFRSTLEFKCVFMERLFRTYDHAWEIEIYEDRPKHAASFEEFFERIRPHLKKKISRQREIPMQFQVHRVWPETSTMDTLTETTEIKRMINVNNQAILDGRAPDATPYELRKKVLRMEYAIEWPTVQKLRSYWSCPQGQNANNFTLLGHHILICVGTPTEAILNRIEPIGSTMSWEATHIGSHENKIWALLARPVDTNVKVYTQGRVPYVVLAHRKEARPGDAVRIKNWQELKTGPFKFETRVDQKMLFTIEDERQPEETAVRYPRNSLEWAYSTITLDDKADFYIQTDRQDQRPTGPRALQNMNGQRVLVTPRSSAIGFASQRGGHGGRDRDRGRRRGRGGGNRGGGRGPHGRGAYRSLDANVGQGYGTAGMEY